LALIKEKSRRDLEERKAQFAINQLVWQDIIVGDDGLMGSGVLANRCSKIICVHSESVEAEMMYVMVDGVRKFSDGDHNAGYVFSYSFIYLEKHIAKNGNVWWKVK